MDSAKATNSVKIGVLLTLVLQNSLLILVMRYSRVMDVEDRYITSTAVFLNEVLKLGISSAVSIYYDGFKSTWTEVFGADSWKLAIPAGLYSLQNSMQYLAASNLDAATFQVTYQLKILSTAFFAVTILHKRLHYVQWLSLVALTMGVAVIQVPTSVIDLVKGFIAPQQDIELSSSSNTSGAFNNSTGLAAVSIACVLSGLAGIYFEKVLKGTRSVSVWVRNIQLSFYSLFPAFIVGCMLKDGSDIANKGFFFGYNQVVWWVIILQAGGGLIVALCVKFADNIAKNFATTLSILVSAIVSTYVFETHLTSNFIVGAATVIAATFLYSSYEGRK